MYSGIEQTDKEEQSQQPKGGERPAPEAIIQIVQNTPRGTLLAAPFAGAHFEPGAKGVIKGPVIAAEIFVQNNYPEIQKQIEAILPKLPQWLRGYYQSQDAFIPRVLPTLLKLPIEKCFVNLSIIGKRAQTEQEVTELKKQGLKNRTQIYSSYEVIFSDHAKTPVKPEELFSRTDKQCLMVFGRAGIGKSTLTQYLSYQWATGKLWQNKFEFVFKIKLRNLTKKNYSNIEPLLPNIIAKECFPNHTVSSDNIKFIANAVAQVLSEQGTSILIILDGLDEFDESTSSCSKAIADLLNGSQTNPQVHLLVTSRPFAKAAHQYLSNEQVEQLECKGFLTEDIPKYIRLEEVKPNPEEQNEIITFLENNPNIHALAHVPVLLDMLCAIWDKDLPKEKSLMTMTEFYGKLMEKLWEQYNRRQKELYPKLKPEERIKQKNKAKQFLETLAFNAMQENQVMISGELVRNAIKKIYQCENEDIANYIEEVLAPGLLCSPNFTLDNYEHCDYYFPHLTFQEFFAAQYIVDQLAANPEQRQIVIEIIKQYKYSSRYEIVWWFLAGLLHLQQNTEIMETFFQILDDPETCDLIGLAHLCLTVRCIDECGPSVNTSRRAFFLVQLKQCMEQLFKQQQKAFELILNYLVISPSVLTAPIILALFEASGFAKGDNDLMAVFTIMLGNLTYLPEVILQQLANLLFYPDNGVKIVAINVLCEQPNLPLSILWKLISIITNNNEEDDIREAAAYAFNNKHNLPDDILQRLTEVTKNEPTNLVKMIIDDVIERQHNSTKSNGIKFEENIILEPDLENLLADTVSSVNGTRVDAVVKLRSQKNLPAWVLAKLANKNLQNKDPNIKKNAADILEQQANLPEFILLKLRDNIDDVNWEIRGSCIKTIGKQNNLPEEILSRLINSALNDEHQWVRECAVQALVNQPNLSEKHVSDLINAILKDKEIANNPKLATKALEKQHHLFEAILHQLSIALGADDMEVKFAALNMLSAIQFSFSLRVLQQITEALKDDNESIRIQVANILAKQSLSTFISIYQSTKDKLLISAFVQNCLAMKLPVYFFRDKLYRSDQDWVDLSSLKLEDKEQIISTIDDCLAELYLPRIVISSEIKASIFDSEENKKIDSTLKPISRAQTLEQQGAFSRSWQDSVKLITEISKLLKDINGNKVVYYENFTIAEHCLRLEELINLHKQSKQPFNQEEKKEIDEMLAEVQREKAEIDSARKPVPQ